MDHEAVACLSREAVRRRACVSWTANEPSMHASLVTGRHHQAPCLLGRQVDRVDLRHKSGSESVAHPRSGRPIQPSPASTSTASTASARTHTLHTHAGRTAQHTSATHPGTRKHRDTQPAATRPAPPTRRRRDAKQTAPPAIGLSALGSTPAPCLATTTAATRPP